MTALRLTGFVLRGCGAAGAVRLLLMAAGVAVGVAAALFVTSVPGVLVQQGRTWAARAPMFVAADGAAPLRVREVHGSWRGARFTRVFVTDVAAGAAAPPGVGALPGPGEVVVSPAAARLLGTDPAFARLLPGRVAGEIGPAGLLGPDELFGYVGTARSAVEPAPVPTGGWGGAAASELTSAQLSGGIPTALALLVLAPALVYFAVCARLSSTTRRRRYAALRLLGVRRKTVLGVAAFESAIVGALGAAAGMAGHAVANQFVGPSGVLGFTWYPAASAVTAGGAVATLVLVTSIGGGIGALGARLALARPLPAGADVAERPAPWWLAVPLVLGLGMLLPLLVTGAPAAAGQPWLVMAGTLLASVGVVLAMRPLVAGVARLLVSERLPVAVWLCGRRLGCEPAGLVRVLAGLVVLVLVAGIGAAVLRQAEHAAGMDGGPVLVRLDAAELPPGARQRAFTLPAAARWSRQVSITQPGASLVMASCTQAERLSGGPLAGCRDGQRYRLSSPGDDPGLAPGDPVRFRGEGDGEVEVRAPEQSLALPPTAGAGMSRGILVTGTDSPTGWSADASYYFELAPGAGAVDRFAAELAALTPAAALNGGPNIVMLEQSRVHSGTIRSGVALGFVLGVLAFVIAALDRAVERRRQVAALAVLGARRRLLRAVQALTLLVPLLVGLVAAVLVAHLAGNALLRLDGAQHGWFLGTLTGSAPLVVAGVAIAAAGGWLTPGARPRAEDLRRE